MKDIDKEKAISLYLTEHKSLAEIGRFFHVSTVTILNRFKLWRIPIRSISESLRGRKIHWKDKIGKANRGNKLSNETKEKISKTRKSKKIIPYNKGLRKATNPDIIMYGVNKEKHWNWKGGISSKNALLRQTSEYKNWREYVFKRDKYTCQICETKGNTLHVHHIIPLSILFKLEKIDINLFNELIFDINNGFTLCLTCHKEIHGAKK